MPSAATTALQIPSIPKINGITDAHEKLEYERQAGVYGDFSGSSSSVRVKAIRADRAPLHRAVKKADA